MNKIKAQAEREDEADQCTFMAASKGIQTLPSVSFLHHL